MAGRKNFVAGEILTASDVNSFLQDQTVMVFDDAAARGSAIPTPSEGMVTYRKDEKTVEVFDGSSFGPIGKILQVVSATRTSTFTTSSSSFVDVTGLTANITPASASNKILIMAQLAGGAATTNNGALQMRLAGGNSSDYVGDSSDSRTRAIVSTIHITSEYRADNALVSLVGNFVDEPNTTSQITYSIQVRVHSGTGFVNRTASGATDASRTSGASSLILLEVAG